MGLSNQNIFKEKITPLAADNDAMLRIFCQLSKENDAIANTKNFTQDPFGICRF